MEIKELREKDIPQLLAELVQLRKAQFNLRMQAPSANKPTHEKGNNRKLIARIKTILTEKGYRV